MVSMSNALEFFDPFLKFVRDHVLHFLEVVQKIRQPSKCQHFCEKPARRMVLVKESQSATPVVLFNGSSKLSNGSNVDASGRRFYDRHWSE